MTEIFRVERDAGKLGALEFVDTFYGIISLVRDAVLSPRIGSIPRARDAYLVINGETRRDGRRETRERDATRTA